VFYTTSPLHAENILPAGRIKLMSAYYVPLHNFIIIEDAPLSEW
jgi:hypothetical protein